jgi:hypothetical protein
LCPRTLQISFNKYLESLELAEDDFVVLKMDIEGMEYPVLKALLAEPRLSALIDELMVEMHYKHPEMAQHVRLNVLPVCSGSQRDAPQLHVSHTKAKQDFTHRAPMRQQTYSYVTAASHS